MKTLEQMAEEAGLGQVKHDHEIHHSMEASREDLERFAALVRDQAIEEWAAWFRRTGDGSMAGLSADAYQLALIAWIKDGWALHDAAAKEAKP